MAGAEYSTPERCGQPARSVDMICVREPHEDGAHYFRTRSLVVVADGYRRHLHAVRAQVIPAQRVRS